MSIGPRQQHHRRTPATTSPSARGRARFAPGAGLVGLGSGLWMLACLFAPQASRAWTESTIHGVQADVAVDSAGSLTVELHLQLQVRAGWLSQLQLSGLESDVAVDPAHPPIMISDDGAVYLPELEVTPGGNIELTFPRRVRAPRHGEYTLSVTYITRQPFTGAIRSRGDRVRLHWRLPPWETGMENIVVQITAPAGSVPSPPEHDRTRVEVEALTVGNSALLRYHRAKLPRMTPLELAFDVPAKALAVDVRPPRKEAPVPRPRLRASAIPAATPFFAPTLWALLAGLALLKLSLSRAYARRHRLQQRFLLARLSPVTRTLWIAAAAGLGALVLGEYEGGSIALGMLLLLPVLERRSSALPLPSKVYHAPASAADLCGLRHRRLMERFDMAALLDMCTPPGALLLASYAALCAVALPVVDNVPQLLSFFLLSIVVFLSGSRRMQPPSIAERVHLLQDLQRRLSDLNTHLTLYRQHLGGQVLEARLSLDLDQPVPGLLQASLLLGEHHWLDRCLLHPCWLLVVEADSPADRAARNALPAIEPLQEPDGRRRAYLATTGPVVREAKALSGWLSAQGTQRAAADAMAA